MCAPISVNQLPVYQPANSHPPDVIERQFSMCQAAQLVAPQPIARWILEEGQLLGVLIASLSPSPCHDTFSCK